MNRHRDAAVRPGGVGLRHIDGARGGGAEHVGQRIIKAGGVLRKAGLHRRADCVLRPHVLIELHEIGVDRMLGGGEHINPAARDAVVILHLKVANFQRCARIVNRALREFALLKGGKQSERLEGGTSLRAILGDGVALAGMVIRAAVHGVNLAVTRISGKDAHVIVLRAILREIFDGVYRCLLFLGVDGGDDPITALAQILFRELPGGHQLLLRVIE